MRFLKSAASAAFAVSLFAMPIIAATTATAAATTATSDLPNLSSVAASESSAAVASTKTTTSSDTTSSGTTTAGSIAVITGGSTATGAATTTSALPTLAGAFTIPTPSVPPTSNAPFMQLSNYPEGTVFIAVGAVLGFLALSVLVWRTMIAWALHRSVKRAAGQKTHVDQKQLFQAPQAPFYNYADKESTLSLGGGGLGGKSGKKRPTTGNGTQSQTSLFFSPTALAGGNNPGNRASNYLPAGYYASGAAAPGAYPGDRQSISMSNLTPQGYTRGHPMDRSPPGSPSHGTHSESSTSDLRPTDGNVRAPSAYLEDLFDGENPLPTPQQGGRDRRSGRY
ncbi:hypothetical protein SBOR_5009 [Sclerotinia borealis F-4128]|uniref:CSI2 protein n=1 Tax=Sclerotinia borealis (strain F-4128) TaxID=1432307 RepID=W9CFB6_SCLBF|nr:hypothetical protein SBOR_5009 [Sclerotinia borealis F-4128]